MNIRRLEHSAQTVYHRAKRARVLRALHQEQIALVKRKVVERVGAQRQK